MDTVVIDRAFKNDSIVSQFMTEVARTMATVPGLVTDARTQSRLRTEGQRIREIVDILFTEHGYVSASEPALRPLGKMVETLSAFNTQLSVEAAAGCPSVSLSFFDDAEFSRRLAGMSADELDSLLRSDHAVRPLERFCDLIDTPKQQTPQFATLVSIKQTLLVALEFSIRLIIYDSEKRNAIRDYIASHFEIYDELASPEFIPTGLRSSLIPAGNFDCGGIC